ncbi:succinylglutamate desuccinylase/aspartoacylase family protein [Legionella spiritensis]|uniref:succinylglutamate desuccinylase/aspartoacylase family protein n=1 Tax=Legionella spiritensis TaxID=452 RepID=UPI000F6C6B2A|nr:succinylglutamate desuccinylase/aspartoacylase family protein [Legionella spiritensis]VEG90498.1 succinylglutamate desuccinylase/aspartoacylase [Legionella spiritensis]
MKHSNLTICDATIHPGETANLALPLPEFYSCTSFYMPIKVVHGKEAGPCLLILSAVKGDELNGLEIINRLLESDRLRRIRGTLIAVPVLNIFGLIEPSRTQRHETSLERCFPGVEHGSYGERLAHVFTREILCKANNCIELQTGSLNHDILPQIYCDLNNAEGRRLAQRFAAPAITNVMSGNNSLRRTTEELNIPLLVYQAGEAMRFNESAINLGISGIFNVMEALDMLDPEESQQPETFRSIFSQDEDWIRAHRSGVLLSNIELGQMIKKGQRIGRINDPFSADTAETVIAPQDGVVVGINRHPLIHEGQTIFKVASFIDNDRAGTVLEAWGDSQAES